MPIAVEDIDLAELANALRLRFGRHLFASYLRGRTLMRDAVEGHLGCSDQEAEELVETLELLGYIEFPHFANQAHPLDRHAWVIGAGHL